MARALTVADCLVIEHHGLHQIPGPTEVRVVGLVPGGVQHVPPLCLDFRALLRLVLAALLLQPLVHLRQDLRAQLRLPPLQLPPRLLQLLVALAAQPLQLRLYPPALRLLLPLHLLLLLATERIPLRAELLVLGLPSPGQPLRRRLLLPGRRLVKIAQHLGELVLLDLAQHPHGLGLPATEAGQFLTVAAACRLELRRGGLLV
mmetsp:Transcript_55002/g.126321  ORF Transcript_55002/g.126321 Transcript_55002/m.126321 type:complete len:203 (-) Transcript_55002:326-934(-)